MSLVPLNASVTIKANLWHTQCIVNIPICGWKVSSVLVMSPAAISVRAISRSVRICCANLVHTPRYIPRMVDAPSEHKPMTFCNGTLYASNTDSNARYTVALSPASNSDKHNYGQWAMQCMYDIILQVRCIKIRPCSASVSVRTSPVYRQTFTNTFSFPFIWMSEASSNIIDRLHAMVIA